MCLYQWGITPKKRECLCFSQLCAIFWRSQTLWLNLYWVDFLLPVSLLTVSAISLGFSSPDPSMSMMLKTWRISVISAGVSFPASISSLYIRYYFYSLIQKKCSLRVYLGTLKKLEKLAPSTLRSCYTGVRNSNASCSTISSSSSLPLIVRTKSRDIRGCKFFFEKGSYSNVEDICTPNPPSNTELISLLSDLCFELSAFAEPGVRERPCFLIFSIVSFFLFRTPLYFWTFPSSVSAYCSKLCFIWALSSRNQSISSSFCLTAF